MESNNIISAPQVENVPAVFENWRDNHPGSLADFYDFMTSPSTQREEFINSLGPDINLRVNSNVAEITLTAHR